MKLKELRPLTFVILLATTFGFILLFAMIFYQYGSLRLTYDSHDFIAASENLNTYLSGRNHDGVPYLHRQPLLPAFLFFFDDKILAAWWLNVLSYGISLFLCFRIGRLLN